MSTNTTSTQTDNVFFDPAIALVTLEQTTRKLRALLADMKNTNYQEIAKLAQTAESAAFAIDKWANAKDCDADDAAWEANRERWSLLLDRMNKHFGSAK